MTKEHLRIAISLGLCIIFVSVGLPAAAKPPADFQVEVADREIPDLKTRLATIERVVEERRREFKIPGAALVIVKGDKILFLKGLGQGDVEHNISATADTLFQIGSTTKSFTAMAAMITVDEGKLSLEDSPRKYLPYFRLQDVDADSKVTIRDLLSHRTGLKAYDDEVWIKNERLSREEVIKAIMMKTPLAKLREKFQYNNVMYTAAGECVARAQNSTWEQTVVSRIFAPLGMRASAPSLRDLNDKSKLSFGYRRGDRPKTIPWRDFSNIAPAGAIISNVRDMALWLRVMIGRGSIDGKRLVSETGFNELVSSQIKVSEQADYGLGWGLVKWEGHLLVTHTGGTDGFCSQVEIMPDQKLGFVLLCNVPDLDLVKEIRKIIWENLLDIHPGKGPA